MKNASCSREAFFLYIYTLLIIKYRNTMKNFLVVLLMAFTFSIASAEVPKLLDDDVGIELVSFVDSVSPDAVVLNQTESFDYQITSASTLEKINRIDRTFFVPSYMGPDLFRRSRYKYNYISIIEKPPLETLPNRLSSFRSVYN